MKTVDTKHYDTPSNQLAKARADLATMRALLDDVRGRLEVMSDTKARDLCKRINDALEPHDEVSK